MCIIVSRFYGCGEMTIQLKPVRLIAMKAIAILALLLTANSALAAPITVTDSLGTHTLPNIPKRPVVLNWNLAEQVIELGIRPLAMTETSNYRDWVVRPAIPAGVEDVGTRAEPNLEKIAALKPDIILISDTQRDLKTTLSQIAPVLLYTNFQASDDLALVAISQFKQLATVFGKQAIAEQKLDLLHHTFVQLHQQLVDHFGEPLPKAVVMRFANLTSEFIYTQNSMPAYVLKQLGLGAALPEPPSRWGVVQKPLSYLQKAGNHYVLYILPFPEEKKLHRSILWQAMPFVRQHRVNAVTPVWSYGGAMSLMYNAEAITASLLALPSSHP